jgi:hypothetical protein
LFSISRTPRGGLVDLGGKAHCLTRRSRLRGHRVQQVANHLVRVCRHTHAAAGANQRPDHLRAGECLPRTGRSLDGQSGSVEVSRDPDREISRALPIPRLECGATETRRLAAQQLEAARGGVAIEQPGRKPHHRPLGRLGRDHVSNEHRAGMDIGNRRSLAHVDEPRCPIEALHLAEPAAVLQLELSLPPNLDLLAWIRIPVHH